ncbi:WD40-repeat-containing domain protein [Cantharellus anzutake]|uniref:WD40-repeat-containing domain protein n=1 Tax=Cantharellus anzutake TaxID=1750568 RepID=UPI0019067E06|nr:WD40-repeat-containing domain protein [Cantharellus anzutake]KAF8330809.1 WD40-repeat-containing domain protein [Cantharellus anzutake]
MLPSPDSSPSRVLYESTNSLFRSPVKNVPISPQGSGRTRKRRRVGANLGSEPITPTKACDGHLATPDQTRIVDGISLSPPRTRLSLYVSRTTRRLPIPRQNSHFTISLARRYNPYALSLRPILQSLVSSSQSDMYRVHASEDSDQTYRTPFVSSFSHAAKRGQGHLLAVGMQEGTLEIIDAKPRQPWEYAPQSITIPVHANSIFDARWNEDDTRIVTSSGDRTSCIVDVATHRNIGVLSAHSLTVKCTLWNPLNPNLLASSSRDGNIHFWDLRTTPLNDDQSYAPVFSIHGAHQDPCKGIALKGKGRTKQTAPVRSVTSINYLPNRQHLVMSSGSADGILKIWDARFMGDFRTSPSRGSKPTTDVDLSLFDLTYDATILKPDSHGDLVSNLGPGSRARGISSVAVDPISGDSVWALSRNGSIYSYRLGQLFDASSAPKDIPLPVTHPCLEVDSFYPRLALSPCGAFLAVGSSNGRLVLWDTKSLLSLGINAKEEAVILEAHTAEVSSVDWSQDELLTSSDDCTVRVWRKDPGRARELRDYEPGCGL